MSIQSHLHELTLKHETLEAILADVLNHPSTTDKDITSIKREKLKLKDQINRIEARISKHNGAALSSQNGFHTY